MPERRLRLGVAGLGRAFTLMLPTLVADPRIELVAAADPRSEALRLFTGEFGGRVYASVEALCADAGVEVVYVATPHQFHAEHVEAAAARGKHVLVEKPMAITLDQCRRMIDAAERANVRLIVGHSHSFDAPILRAREIIAGGALGAVRMINAQYYTDFLYRPRRPEELDTAQGGGAVFSQAAHQVDIVRLLGGGRVHSVRAQTGAWDPARSTEGAYAALLVFDDGSYASLAYSGYAHFDGDELCGGVGEMGMVKRPDEYGAARRSLRRAAELGAEAALKNARNYGGAEYAQRASAAPAPAAPSHQHFGLVLVCCEHGDLRPMPDGVMIYGDGERHLEPLTKPRVPRAEVIDELYAAVVSGHTPVHGGRWAMATLEVCLAMLRSARERRDIVLADQVGLPS
ncbi:MAG TPA: Gfo/Idh/MocA family oxidoreductase [Casimicrobiaceae bacterium]|jgi:phthalate 4,5-cis-dihydrodiol dehydrogenase|nr:Gfo/Idh/MocA family oxidoreductase [Casimicrobiaceae bacterium]